MRLITKKYSIRDIQLVLGGLWIIDGLLQLQRQMFTSSFVNKVIDPASAGQPILVSGPIHFFAHIFLLNPILFNTFTILTQLGIGFLILNKKTTKYGLISSIFWGLFVWSIGEAYGGLLGFHSIILMGAPGAALIYVLLSLAVLPKNTNKKINTKTSYPPYWLIFVWSIIWIVGAIYMLLPGQNNVADLGSMFSQMSSGLPGWLASIDIHIANTISSFGAGQTSSSMHMSTAQMMNMSTQQYRGFWFILLTVIVQVAIGIVVFFPGKFRKLAIYSGLILSLIFWVIGQSFGGIFSGVGTDPNSGPLIILLGLAILSSPNTNKDLSKFLDRIERFLT